MKQRIKAIGYIRQSDEREDKEDISEQTQLSKIQQYCEFNDWELAEVFKDIDYSGFRIKYTKRPGIMQAIEYIKNNPVQKLVIFNLSRLTRRRQDFLLIQESLNKLKVDICSTAEQLDFGSPTGRLVANILVNFNEYYSDNLSDVTMDSKKTNAEKGRWNGGPAPFGLKKQNDGFVIDVEKADAIKLAFSMAKDGKGTYLIANKLNGLSVLTKTGKSWSPRRVRYVLTNPTYAGMQKWQGKFYPLKNCEKLVEWDDFMYIQDTLFGKEKVWKGKERHLLSSLLRCPVCGGKMHARFSTGKKSRRYVCNKKNTLGHCPSPNFDLPTLDDAVIQTIGVMSKMRYDTSEIIPQLNETQDDRMNTLKKLHDEYNRLDAAKQKVFDDYYINNKLTEEQFNDLMKRYEKRQNEIDESLKKIPLPRSKTYGDYDDIIEEFVEALSELPKQEKRKSIELLIDKIIPGEPTQIFFKWGEVMEIIPKEIKKYNQKVYFY
ncbi:recombinase family protein [Paenibacillus larvae]|uniref:Putative DNA recombinase CisA n=1 Tax=Paenibacillus larvae subsp. larvae TaxID=147375 RepID=A0A6C0QQL4_9BACL|nr:recombinase family protein [Paenibacillus larvae]QHZ50870.1 putative DNA recombinase CisA [Paenibacillus larvae subsp. larvae]